MKGMILAAGRGERLRPETDRIPKPLFALGGTNMIRNAIGYLRANGIADIAVNLYHLKEMIKEELSLIPRQKVTLNIVEEEQLMGTAGGIKGAQAFLENDTFVTVNSDVLIDLDLAGPIALHREKNALATLVLRDSPDPARYGTLRMDNEGRLVDFLDHRSPGYDETDLAGGVMMFTGVTVFSPEIFSHLPGGRPVDISTEVYPKLMETGAPVYTWRHTGYFADIGTPESYRAACDDVEHRRFEGYTL